MINKRYYSIEGLTGGGKTTLMSNLENPFPGFYFYPQEEDKKDFNEFIQKEKILLNPLKDPYEQNRKFEKFLANEQRKHKKFKEILKYRNILSDRDYLSCFSSAYTHAVLENTGNEKFIKEKIEEFEDSSFFIKPYTRFYIKVSVNTALERKRTRKRDPMEIDGSYKKLEEYMQIQKGFLEDYILEKEHQNTIIIDGEREPEKIFYNMKNKLERDLK